MEKNENMKKAIFMWIDTKDNQVQLEVAEDMTFNTMVQLIASLGLEAMRAAFAASVRSVENNTADLGGKSAEAYLELCKEDIYQVFNVAMSSILSQFIPDKDMRPDITAEALMAMEEKIIEEKFNALSEEDKEKSRKFVEKQKAKLKAK